MPASRPAARNYSIVATDATSHLRLRRDFIHAIGSLREFTLAPADTNLFAVLIRCAVASPAAADVLLRASLRTRAERRSAVVEVAVAMAAEIDADAGAVQ
jgi:hypothetical protein